MDRETGPKPTAIRQAAPAGSLNDDLSPAARVRPPRSGAGSRTPGAPVGPAATPPVGAAANTAVGPAADTAVGPAADSAVGTPAGAAVGPAADSAVGTPAGADDGATGRLGDSQPDEGQLADDEADATAEAAEASWQLQRVGFPSRLIMAQLAADPRVPIWIRRAVGVVVVATGFGFWLGWRYGLTIAAVAAILDTVYQSKTVSLIPAAARVAFAQRRTMNRLQLLRPLGYHALHARPIPGTESIIDHLLIGPGGVFAIDSERWDRRLPVRTVASNSAAGPVLYHGPFSQKDRLAHARWEAAQATHLLSRELRRQITVRPVMVIYGPTVPWTVAKLRGVDVLSGRKLVRYFSRRTRVKGQTTMDWEQIGEIVAAAERALPRS